MPTITLRPFCDPDDREAICAFDASFTTERVYRVVVADRSFTLREEIVSPPLRKVYDMRAVVVYFPKLDDVRVAELDGQVVGVAAYSFDKENRRGLLEHIYVDRAHRGSGVGHALMETVIARARQDGARCLWLETQDINHDAIRFYVREGFEWCGLDLSLDVRRGLPSDETAIFFMKPLK